MICPLPPVRAKKAPHDLAVGDADGNAVVTGTQGLPGGEGLNNELVTIGYAK